MPYFLRVNLNIQPETRRKTWGNLRLKLRVQGDGPQLNHVKYLMHLLSFTCFSAAELQLCKQCKKYIFQNVQEGKIKNLIIHDQTLRQVYNRIFKFVSFVQLGLLFKKYLFLSITGWAESLLLHAGFLQFQRAGAASLWSMCSRARGLQQLLHMGSVVVALGFLEHRWILDHWTNKLVCLYDTVVKTDEGLLVYGGYAGDSG